MALVQLSVVYHISLFPAALHPFIVSFHIVWSFSSFLSHLRFFSSLFNSLMHVFFASAVVLHLLCVFFCQFVVDFVICLYLLCIFMVTSLHGVSRVA